MLSPICRIYLHFGAYTTTRKHKNGLGGTMNLGIDLGNDGTKSSQMVNVASKCTTVSNILSSNQFQTETGTYYMGEGTPDNEYRKVKKTHLKTLFLYIIALSTQDQNIKAVVGLPISQYRQDKDELKSHLLTHRYNVTWLNGTQRKINIEDVDVYPEGLINSEDGILLDIGGRTTDIALIENKKVNDCFSIAAGTLNLYADFINAINSQYGLDLKPSDADRIIRKGLQINGVETDVTFAQGVFKSFVADLVSQIQVKYPVSTLPITVLGGGGQLLFKSIKNRLPNSTLVDNPIFANALLFKRVGDAKWP